MPPMPSLGDFLWVTLKVFIVTASVNLLIYALHDILSWDWIWELHHRSTSLTDTTKEQGSLLFPILYLFAFVSCLFSILR